MDHLDLILYLQGIASHLGGPTLDQDTQRVLHDSWPYAVNPLKESTCEKYILRASDHLQYITLSFQIARI